MIVSFILVRLDRDGREQTFRVMRCVGEENAGRGGY